MYLITLTICIDCVLHLELVRFAHNRTTPSIIEKSWCFHELEIN